MRSFKEVHFIHKHIYNHARKNNKQEIKRLHCDSDRPLHMTDVKLFTHAFSAKVSTESAHLKHDGFIRVMEFLQINQGHVWSCTTGPAK